MNGSLEMREYNAVYFLNPVPTLIQQNQRKFLVFSKCSAGDPGPATYVYDLNESVTFMRILGAEVFIDFFNDLKKPDNDGHMLFLSSKSLRAHNFWADEITEKDGAFFNKQ